MIARVFAALLVAALGLGTPGAALADHVAGGPSVHRIVVQEKGYVYLRP